MNWWQALLLGLVEGVTEFLPVSSTAHLLLMQRVLRMPGTEASNAYAIAIQFGAIAAVLVIYRARLVSMFKGVLGRDPMGLRLALNVALAFLPAALVGFCFNNRIEALLFGLWPVTVAWFVGGIVILAEPWRRREDTTRLTLDTLAPRHALLIGLAQCAALWPGTSRSLATIVGALLLGVEMAAAVEFSFLVGLVTLTAAAGFKALKSRHALLEAYEVSSLIAGVTAAGVSAFAAVRWMLSMLGRAGLRPFGWYRIALAIMVAGGLATGVVQAS